MMSGGVGKISLALGRKPGAPQPTNGIKRSHAALREDDDEENDEGRAQKVSHFDKTAGGAVDESDKQPKNAPLVITKQANRDWRDASKRRRQRNGLPAEAQQSGSVSEQAIRDLEAQKPGFGLNVTKRKSEDGEPIIDGQDRQAEAEVTQEQPPEPNGDASVQQKTDDELAMDALLGKTTRQDLVVPAVSEEEAFEQDIQSAPDMATLDDYARVPVEQFGAALLRGMGWKDGEGIGTERGKKVQKTKVPERRPALLGIGAREEAAVAQEMGVWGKAAKRGNEVKIYNPILLKDKKTGELFTEEELQKKRERDERAKYEEEFDRKEREKEDRRRKEARGESRDGDRDRRERPRRREKDREDDRRRHDHSDDEYSRRKERDKEQRRRPHHEDDRYDRERSRRHDREHDRRRDRDRDRDGDRHRDRKR